MKILITGANGLLGHHVVMELQKRQHQLKIIVRSTDNLHFNTSTLEICVGNFTNPETLSTAAMGCDAIIHIAAITSTNLLHYNQYHEVNVKASALIIDVANQLGINTLIFVSTANTIGYGKKNESSDETAPFQFPFTNSYYARSKAEAEKLFEKAALETHRHVIIINPTFLIGSFDTKPSSGKLILMGYKKKWIAVPQGGKNFVAASSVAIAICNALTQGRNGERYLTPGINLTFKEYFNFQKTIAHYKQHVVVVPNFLLRIAGKIGDLLRWLGISTDVCSMNISQLLIAENYESQKAHTELGMPNQPLEIAIEEAIDWFNTQKKY